MKIKEKMVFSEFLKAIGCLMFIAGLVISFSLLIYSIYIFITSYDVIGVIFSMIFATIILMISLEIKGLIEKTEETDKNERKN